MKFAAAVLAATLAWAAMNYLIWRWTAASVQRMSPREARPWNWRVLVGAFAYYPWLNRWEEANRPAAPAPRALDALSHQMLISPTVAAEIGRRMREMMKATTNRRTS